MIRKSLRNIGFFVDLRNNKIQFQRIFSEIIINNQKEIIENKNTSNYNQQFSYETDEMRPFHSKPTLTENGGWNFFKNDDFDKKMVPKSNFRLRHIHLSGYTLIDFKPDKGIKKKEGKCFIATATMGCYDHPQVMELRHFRDEWILTKNWGESFVKWYYHYGEKVAKVIDKSVTLKKISYLLIVKPLVYLSRIVKK